MPNRKRYPDVCVFATCLPTRRPADPPTHRPPDPPTHRPTDPRTHRPTDPPIQCGHCKEGELSAEAAEEAALALKYMVEEEALMLKYLQTIRQTPQHPYNDLAFANQCIEDLREEKEEEEAAEAFKKYRNR
jgi:hypothetical protein